MLEYAGVSRRNDQWDDRLDYPITKGQNVLNSTVCPTQLHPPRRLPCRCLYLLRLDSYLREKTISKWHRDTTLPLKNFRLNQPPSASRGGQGVVFYMHDCDETSKKFALKFKDRQERAGSMWEIEKREMEILSQVRHPFIVRLLHSYETRRGLFMAMEYLSGGTLWSVVNRYGLLSEANGIYFSAAMIDALQYLHGNNLIFRDLKAENVALDSEGRPRLIDFGLAKYIASPGDNYPMTRYDFVSYLAPEIYRNPDKCDFKVDSWGIGYFLTELILGYGIRRAIPWEILGRNHLAEDWCFQLPPEEEKVLSEPCRIFLQSMLARDPTLRPSIAEAKTMPFFSDVIWELLSEATPPEYLYTGETLDEVSKTNTSPEKALEDVIVEEEPEKEEEEKEKEYCAILNAPTIISDSNFQYPQLKNQVQLPVTEKVTLLPPIKPKVGEVVFLTVGNL